VNTIDTFELGANLKTNVEAVAGVHLVIYPDLESVNDL